MGFNDVIKETFDKQLDDAVSIVVEKIKEESIKVV